MSTVPDAMLDLLQSIYDEQVKSKDALTALEKRLVDHINDEESMMERHTAEIVALQASFPNGDLHGHQMYHASIIARNEWITEVFKDAAKHIAKYGLVAFLVWLLWHGLSDLVHSIMKDIK